MLGAFGLWGFAAAAASVILISICPPLVVALRQHNSVVYPPRISKTEELALQTSLFVNNLLFSKNTFLVGVPLVHLSLAARNRHNLALADKRMKAALSVADSVDARKAKFEEVNNALVLAAELTKMGRFRECIQLGEKTLAMAEKLTDFRSIKAHAQLLLVCAFASWSLGELDECGAFSREALDLGGDALDSKLNGERFHAYNFLMLLEVEQANFEKAAELVERSRRYAKSLTNVRKGLFMHIVNTNQAVVHIGRAEYGKAEELLIATHLATKKNEGKPFTENDRISGRAAVLLAVLYAECGRAHEAQEYFNFVSSLMDKSGELMMKVIFANDLAYSMYLLKRPAEAEQYLHMSGEILKDYIPEDHYLRATLANNLAEVNLALGKLGPAKAALEKARQIRTLIFNNDHPNIVRLHQTGAMILMEENFLDEALKEAEYVVASRRRTYPAMHMENARSLEVYSEVLAKLGRTEESVAAAQKVSDIREAARKQLRQQLTVV